MSFTTRGSAGVLVLLLLAGVTLRGQDVAPAPSYDLNAEANQYLNKTFGASAFAMAAGSAVSHAEFGKLTGWKNGHVTMADRMSTNFFRNGTAQTIEFGTAALLRQDQRYAVSHETSLVRRSRAALYHSLFVAGADGDELAIPRVATILGTPWAMRDWHPGRRAAPDPWVQSAFLLARYVARSYWAEFRPDAKRAWRNSFLNSLHRANP